MKYIGYVNKFINDLNVDLAGMVPSDNLVTSGWCLARSGDEYVVYLSTGGSTTVSGLLGTCTATWFNPRNGTTQAASGSSTFTVPDGNDWVLHITCSVIPESVDVDFGDTDIENGLARMVPEAANANTTGATIGGRNCRRNVDSADRHFFMLVSDDWAWQGNKPAVKVTIEYYDTGTDGISLVHDGTSGDVMAGTIDFTNTDTWKSHTFYITDAYFGNRSGTGYDFRISAKTLGTIFYIDTVLVENNPPVPSDFDEDYDVDQEDFGFLQQCYSGLQPYDQGCEPADLNGSGNVNLDDFDVFYSCMDGVAQPPDC